MLPVAGFNSLRELKLLLHAGQTLFCSVIFRTLATPVISGKQQAFALGGSFRTSRLLSAIGLITDNVFYAKHITSVQSLSSLCPSNNARRFLQMKLTVALGHRFKIYTTKSRGYVLRSRGYIYINESPWLYGTSETRYTKLSVGISAKRGRRWLGSTPSQRDRSLRPSKDGRMCIATPFAWKPHVLSDPMTEALALGR